MPLWCAIGVLAVRAMALPWWEKPKPAVLDEFSYLLLADTLASARVTNPVHPLWEHFETLFVLQRPSYASVYPPAQGIALAIGQVVFGDPWWGVWLSIGAMGVAAGWMLQGWLPAFWATLGTIWIAVQLGLISYWMNSYWGGAMSATAGALVMGAAPRLIRRATLRDGALLGLGIALLAISRPYEGLVLGACCVAWVLARTRHWRAMWPGGVVVAACMLWMGWYCWRITGSWQTLPAQEYIRQYAASPVFIWQPVPPEPRYRDAVLRNAHVKLLVDYEQFQTIGSGLRFIFWKLLKLGTFYLGPVILLPLVMTYWLWRSRHRFLLIIAVAVLVAILVTVPLQPHYAAPAAAAFYALAVQSLRILRAAGRRGNPFGRVMTIASPAVAALVIVLAFVVEPPRVLLRQRYEMQGALRRVGGQHLVIVRYGDVHNLAEEWVYNHADIDTSDIVWARDLGRERNERLIRYYPQRRVWILDADTQPVQLREQR